MAEEVPDPSEEATAAVLSNGYDVPVKLPFKQLCLYSSSSLGTEALFVMIREAAETYNWSVYREEVLECPTIERLSISPPQRLREHCGRRRGRARAS